MKKIIAAIDFSNATSGVTSTATEMAKAFGAELHLLHVIEAEPTYTAYGLSPSEFPVIHDFHVEARNRAQKTLDEVAAKIAAKGITPTAHLAEGSPLLELEAKTKEIGADFVILGSHGHSVIAALILGSVAEGMIRKALVPTLVIPASDVK
ncbi:MAG: universal stress protein [Verrucomicrobiota bacterium]